MASPYPQPLYNANNPQQSFYNNNNVGSAPYGQPAPFGQPQQQQPFSQTQGQQPTQPAAAFGNPQPFGQPYPQQHQQQQQQGFNQSFGQQQQAQQPQQPFNPSFLGNNAAFLNNVSPMMTSLGGELINKQANTWFSNFSVFWNALKLYFLVNNSYVLRKLLIILYPFQNKQWMRLAADEASYGQTQSTHKWALPRDDINSPDLYIPLMSFASYILLVGLAKGLGGDGFTPELLLQTIWRCFFLQMIEASIIVFLLSFKQINAAFLDIVSYTGYKYVGLCLHTLIRFLGFYPSLVSALYTSLMLGIFVVKAFRSVVPKSAGVTTTGGGATATTTGPPGLYIQLACGGLQFAVMFILCML